MKVGVSNYQCVMRYKFATSRMQDRFYYKDLLELGKQLEEPYFLDIGCCTGTDLRKLAVDNYPKECLIGIDILKKYIDIGHQQFKDDPETCPIQFIVQDIFKIDTSYFLANTISIVHAGSVFHLFKDDEMVLQFLQKVTLLLKPGGVLVGSHVSSDKSIKFFRKKSKTMKYFMDSDKFTSLLSQSGFSQIKLKTVPKAESTRDSCLLENTLYWMSFYAVYNPIY